MCILHMYTTHMYHPHICIMYMLLYHIGHTYMCEIGLHFHIKLYLILGILGKTCIIIHLIAPVSIKNNHFYSNKNVLIALFSQLFL